MITDKDKDDDEIEERKILFQMRVMRRPLREDRG